jgi:hypothetical protein
MQYFKNGYTRENGLSLEANFGLNSVTIFALHIAKQIFFIPSEELVIYLSKFVCAYENRTNV